MFKECVVIGTKVSKKRMYFICNVMLLNSWNGMLFPNLKYKHSKVFLQSLYNIAYSKLFVRWFTCVIVILGHFNIGLCLFNSICHTRNAVSRWHLDGCIICVFHKGSLTIIYDCMFNAHVLPMTLYGCISTRTAIETTNNAENSMALVHKF